MIPVPIPDHDAVDRVTLICPGDHVVEFDRAYIATDADYARPRIGRLRYETHDDNPPADPRGSHLVASLGATLVYTGSVESTDYEVVNGTEYVELRCSPPTRRDP